jgi:ribonuclease PH
MASMASIRPIKVTRNFTQAPAGSVLWEQGKTIVLVTASISLEVPPFFREDRPGGWVTAEYVMLPGSTPGRKPWPKIGHTDSRGTEIQRLIGRSLRAIIDLSKIGPHTIAIDCHVLQADGGTRTACISAAYVALADAVKRLPAELPNAIRPTKSFGFGDATLNDPATIPASRDPRYYDPQHAILDQLAAVSVGIVDGQPALDLDYRADSKANVDMNVAQTKAGKFVEIQGAAENGQGFDRATMNTLLDLATDGCRQIMEYQSNALATG